MEPGEALRLPNYETNPIFRLSAGILVCSLGQMLQNFAASGSVDAAMALGVLYWYGAGPNDANGPRALPADRAKAMGFCRQAAVKDHVPAQLILADLYASEATGIEPNLAEAVRLYGQAAKAGEVRAQCRLAVMYDRGQGVQRNISEATPWYQKCAQGGDGTAMFRLAELYDTGEGG